MAKETHEELLVKRLKGTIRKIATKKVAYNDVETTELVERQLGRLKNYNEGQYEAIKSQFNAVVSASKFANRQAGK